MHASTLQSYELRIYSILFQSIYIFLATLSSLNSHLQPSPYPPAIDPHPSPLHHVLFPSHQHHHQTNHPPHPQRLAHPHHMEPPPLRPPLLLLPNPPLLQLPRHIPSQQHRHHPPRTRTPNPLRIQTSHPSLPLLRRDGRIGRRDRTRSLSSESRGEEGRRGALSLPVRVFGSDREGRWRIWRMSRPAWASYRCMSFLIASFFIVVWVCYSPPFFALPPLRLDPLPNNKHHHPQPTTPHPIHPLPQRTSLPPFSSPWIRPPTTPMPRDPHLSSNSHALGRRPRAVYLHDLYKRPRDPRRGAGADGGGCEEGV